MQTEKVQMFLNLTERQKALEEEVEAVKREKGALERELIDEFARDGIQSLNVNGSTVYLYHKTTARAKDNDKERLIKALLQAGLEQYVDSTPRYNTQSVEAYIREHIEGGQELPALLAAAVEVTDLFFIRSRKA